MSKHSHALSLLFLFGHSLLALTGNQNAAGKEPERQVTLEGRVANSNGHPVSRARLYLAVGDMWYSVLHGYGKTQETPRQIGVTDSDGTFSVRVALREVRRFDLSSIVAVGPEGSKFGVDWGDAALFNTADKSLRNRAAEDPAFVEKWQAMRTLRLCPDDVPVRGTILNAAGKPMSGVRVRVANIQQLRNDDLSGYLDIAKRGNPRDYDDARIRFKTKSFFGELGRRNGFGDLISAKTNDTGEFTIHGFGANRVGWLIVNGANVATDRLLVRSQSGGSLQMRDGDAVWDFFATEFRFRTRQSCSVVGTITDQKTGKPVRGVVIENLYGTGELIHGRYLQRQRFLSTTTDKNGQYRLDGLPTGSKLRLLASSHQEPYLPSIQYHELPTGNKQQITVDWKLKPGVWIEGRVSNSRTNHPIISQLHYFAFRDNANVADAIGFQGSLSYPIEPPFITNANGEYRIAGLQGRGLVTIRARFDFDGNNYPTNKGQEGILGANGTGMWASFDVLPAECRVNQYHGVQEVNPQPGDSRAVRNFALTPSETLSGRVFDSDGKPLNGFIYSGMFERGFFMSRKPQKTNEFQVRDYDPTFPRRLIFHHEEQKLAGTVVLRGQQTKPIEVRLQPQGTFVGRVVDDGGKPLAGIILEVAPLIAPKLPMSISALPQPNYTTDAKGRFLIEGVAPGMKYNLVTRTTKGMKQVLFDAVTESGETTDLGDLKLKPLQVAK